MHMTGVGRWHQTLKNRILLENHYLPGDLEAQIEGFVGRLTTVPTFDVGWTPTF